MTGLSRSAPLILFVILLLTLAISVYFGNALKHWNLEGYIGFNNTGQLVNRKTRIEKYTNAHDVIKLYDNMYFDPLNANLLELEPGQGDKISKIAVYDREGTHSGPYDVSNGIPVASAGNKFIKSVRSVFTMKSVLSPDSIPAIIYVTWDKDTFIHVVDFKVNTNVLSAHFSGTMTSTKVRNFDWNPASSVLNTTPAYSIASLLDNASVADSSNGIPVKVQYYDPSKTPIQICKDTFYDPSNGNLLVKMLDLSLNVYERPQSLSIDPSPQVFNATTPMTKSENEINTTTDYSPWMLLHPNKNCLIYYVAYGLNTIIVVLTKNGTSLEKKYAYFYQSDGIVPVDQTQTQSQPTPAAPTAPAAPAAPAAPDPNPLSEYDKWHAFWNVVVSSSDLATAMRSSNYVPKTAIIPPICPSCAHSSGGVCTNCGGNGGSGSNTGRKNKFSDFLALYGAQGGAYGGAYGPGGGPGGGPRGSGIPGSDSERAYQMAKDAGSGTVGLVRDAGEAGLGVLAVGTVLGAEAVGGTVGLAKEAVGGTVGLAKETVGGAIGLAKEAGSGLTGVLKSNPMQLGGGGEGGVGGPGLNGGGMQDTRQGQGTRGGKGSSQNMIDPYSYNGALVSKGGNYMPITTDFSAFGK